MKKGLIYNLEDERKIAASDFAVEVHFASDEVIEHTFIQYTYEDVFEGIKEYYQSREIEEEVSMIVIKIKR